MHRYLAVAAAVLIAGCASTSNTSNTSNTTSTAQKPMEEKQYRVGSNIPVKDPGARTN